MKKSKTMQVSALATILLLPVFLLFFSLNTAFAENIISQESRLLLQKLVETNSGTKNISGQDNMRSVLVPEFNDLGFAETLHPAKKGRKVLSFKFPDSKPYILFMGHTDTVFPENSEFKTYQEKGDRIIGPGVIDMKGGIVLMLDVLKAVPPVIRKNVLIILNDDEEVGSFESKEVYTPLVNDIRYALVFEPGLKDGTFISSESGIKWLDLEVKGRASHAGLEPDLGVNACLELANKITAISALTDYSKKLTVNAGVISGGIKPNVVCENAMAKIDIRYVEKDDLNNVIGKIREITNTVTVFSKRNNEPTTASLKPVLEMPSLKPASTREMIKITGEVAAKLDMDFKHQHVGYGSDGNYLSALPQVINILVGLGPYGEGMHTDSEYLSQDAYVKRLKLTIALLKRLVQ
ncbi:MAG: M20 family metallopeptidase [Desulfobacterales bacterium]|nr:M20 family metallopeptidase [Desulfobacterales bacterium]